MRQLAFPVRHLITLWLQFSIDFDPADIVNALLESCITEVARGGAKRSVLFQPAKYCSFSRGTFDTDGAHTALIRVSLESSWIARAYAVHMVVPTPRNSDAAHLPANRVQA
jgi:hypothetical protein